MMPRLDSLLDELGTSWAVWGQRDDEKPQPDVRLAASAAVRSIDGLLAELHQMRARLVSEIRVSDKAADARADALLAALSDAEIDAKLTRECDRLLSLHREGKLTRAECADLIEQAHQQRDALLARRRDDP
jgi:hypothetical protein